ncbi:MAG: hypothetical protein QOJ42_6470 [Acidobacteriaceae bacterium]|nr:hypothetical protein [Acidobacteriaceae bacterium]
MQKPKVLPVLICFSLAVSLIALRVMLWPIQMPDFVNYFLPWQDYLIAHGGVRALRHSFSDYFPAYFELTAIVAVVARRLSHASQLKLLPIPFDLLAAGTAYKLVGILQSVYPRIQQGMRPRIVAAFVVLGGPTVILNGTIGTADIIYTSFLLLTVYFLCSDRGAWASLAYGFAFAFKLQSVFLAPFFLAMVLRRKVPLWSLLLLPVGWGLALLPVLAVGGSPANFFTNFSVQTSELNALAINVGNPWEIANFLHVPFHAGMLIGLAITAIVGLSIASLGLMKASEKPDALVALAALSLLAMPYVMPKMHDRYFFAGEVLLSILACVDRDYLASAALVISASLVCYAGYFMSVIRHTATPAALLGTTVALYLTGAKVKSLLDGRWAAQELERSSENGLLTEHTML